MSHSVKRFARLPELPYYAVIFSSREHAYGSRAAVANTEARA